MLRWIFGMRRGCEETRVDYIRRATRRCVDEAEKYGIVYIAVTDERGRNSAKGFQVYFASQRSSHVLKINNFNTKGQIFRAYEKDTVYTVWKIKVFEELLLEDDLKNPCKNYPKKKDYSKV